MTTPIFILQNSKPVTNVLFSLSNSDTIYTGNRDGYFTVYSLKLRRSMFVNNPEKQSILSIMELDENTVLTYGRNGSVFKWTTNNSSYDVKCKIL